MHFKRHRKKASWICSRQVFLVLIGHHLISWHDCIKLQKGNHCIQLVTLLISVTCFCKHYIHFIPCHFLPYLHSLNRKTKCSQTLDDKFSNQLFVLFSTNSVPTTFKFIDTTAIMAVEGK